MAHILQDAFEGAALEQKEKVVEKQNKSPAVASTMAMDQDSIPPPIMGEKDAATVRGRLILRQRHQSCI